MAKYASALDLMKNSPLLALKGRNVARPRGQLWAKLELALPGAMKDRVALQTIRDAEKSRELRPGGLIIESSSGTLAEGIARVGTLLGYRVIIVTDPRLDDMTCFKLEAFGATVDIVKEEHPTGGWQAARLERLAKIQADHPDAFWTRQYDNPSNAGAYVEQMAGEIYDDLGESVAALVGSVGSGGSLSGTARGLRQRIPDLRVVAVDAVGSVLFHQPARQRLQSGHGNNIVAGNLDYGLIDEVHWISDGEAFAACGELTRREGVFGGGSSGAVYIAASWLAEQVEPGQHVVAILPDRGDRYYRVIYSSENLEAAKLIGVEAGRSPISLRYGVDVAESWSCAELPRDGSPLIEESVQSTVEISQELGLE